METIRNELWFRLLWIEFWSVFRKLVCFKNGYSSMVHRFFTRIKNIFGPNILTLDNIITVVEDIYQSASVDWED